VLLRDERAVSIGLATMNDQPARAHPSRCTRAQGFQQPSRVEQRLARRHSCCSSDYPSRNLGDAYPGKRTARRAALRQGTVGEQILGTRQQVEQRPQRGTTKEENEAAHKDEHERTRRAVSDRSD